jgi:uncharacterized protein (DUF1697 family)
MRQSRYVALLRGINVGGHLTIKMDGLRKLFESLGLDDVSTYIQSGNVLFSTDETDREKLSPLLERSLYSATGREVTVFVMTRPELDAAASHNPFEPELHDLEQNCVLMFLSKEPETVRVEKLMSIQGQVYRFHLWKKVLYYAYDKKDAMKRKTIDFERVLGVSGTSRSWKVVNKLRELLG